MADPTSTAISAGASLIPVLFGTGTTNTATNGTSSSTMSGTQSQQQSSQQRQNSQVSTLGQQDQDLLRKLATLLLGQGQQFTREQAIADTQSLAGGAQKTLLESILPGINAEQASSGAYSSTAKTQLGNDAATRLATEIAQLRLNTINQYAQNRQSSLQGAGSLLDILKGATTTSTSESDALQKLLATQDTTTDTTSTSTQKSGNKGLLGGLLGGLFG